MYVWVSIIVFLCFSYTQSAKHDDLKERLEESEKLMSDMGKTWGEKLKETERVHQVRVTHVNYYIYYYIEMEGTAIVWLCTYTLCKARIWDT